MNNTRASRFKFVDIFERTMLFNLGFGCLIGPLLVPLGLVFWIIALIIGNLINGTPIVDSISSSMGQVITQASFLIVFLVIDMIFLSFLLGMVNLIASPINAVLIISATSVSPASGWLKGRYRSILLGATMVLTFFLAFIGYATLLKTEVFDEDPVGAYLLYSAIACANGVASVLASRRVLRWYETEYPAETLNISG